MSEQNVEIARRWVDAYNRRDMDDLIELDAVDFVFRSVFVAVEAEFRGQEGFPFAYFKTLDEAYEHFVVIPSEFIDAGAAVLMVASAEWRGRMSGAQGETPILTAFWMRAGKILRAETFTERAEALEAVGLG
jgi:ketosteroid isomerase-like protein